MKIVWAIAACLIAVVSLGCGSATTGPSASTGGSKYVATTEPAGSVNVAEARKSSKDDEMVIVVGRIGGSADPFVEGMAAFTIVDNSIPPCKPDEGCPTPWDYCCEADLKNVTALVQVVDDQGQPIAEDAKKLLNVKELAMVVVEGKAKRDDKGNLTVHANKVFVKE